MSYPRRGRPAVRTTSVPGSLLGPVARTRSPAPRCARQSKTARAARSKSARPAPTPAVRCAPRKPSGIFPERAAPTGAYVRGTWARRAGRAARRSPIRTARGQLLCRPPAQCRSPARLTGTVLPAVTATRYVTPLREGGSLPGLMEADDLGTYVVKWRVGRRGGGGRGGAGQGVRVLVAEVVCGEPARALGLPVPALTTVDVAAELAVGEPDFEVQELMQRSAGRNLGLDYLPGALDFEAGVGSVGSELAGQVLWFDALVGNVDRSWRNPNMLFWHGGLYLIDHGAALTFHHSWAGATAAVSRPYDAASHALVECAPDVAAADDVLAPRVTEELLATVLARVPDDWLE